MTLEWIFGLLGLLVGAAPLAIPKLLYYWNTTRPFRAFWCPMFDGGLSIVTAAEEREPVIKSQVFDFIATSDVEKLFQKIFPRQCYRYTCEERGTGVLSRNLLLVGGPIPNDVTRDMLNTLNARYVFQGNDIMDKANVSIIRQAEKSAGLIIKDYGIITKCINPFNRAKKAIIVMGCYGWGTWAALKVLLDVEKLDLISSKRFECYQVLVSVNVHRRLPEEPILDIDTFVEIK